MKRLVIFSISMMSIFFSLPALAQEVKIKEDKVKIKKDETKMDKTDMSSSYKASYSSDFKIGNQAYANMILEMWKDWDDNMLDRHDYMADSLVMSFADGTEIKGKQANMDAAKKFRGSMKSVKTTLHAMVPLRSNDRNVDVVCMWGEEENTLPDGKVEKRPIHEVWFFNKDGKIFSMRQWVGALAK